LEGKENEEYMCACVRDSQTLKLSSAFAEHYIYQQFTLGKGAVK